MDKRLIYAAVIFIGVVIALAHLITPDSYSWTENTISDLGAQGYTHGWLMSLGFVGFGILVIAGYITKSLKAGRVSVADALLMVYGASVLMTGLFRVAPFDGSLDYSAQQDALHSFFAQAAGVAFTLAIVAHIVAAPTPALRLRHFAVLLVVITNSLLVAAPEFLPFSVPTGVAQRFLWIVSFAWLLSTVSSTRLASGRTSAT
ncbi:MAG: DUF998 domain-containing protein [Caldilineaceae bacterium]